jgi:galactokinase
VVTDGPVELRSDAESLPLDVAAAWPDPTDLEPPWGRTVIAVLHGLGTAMGLGTATGPGTATGLRGTVTTTLPLGAGLSSSAALLVAVALAAIGCPPDDRAGVATLAGICRDAEEAATGVPCGTMDQLCILSAREGHATLVDAATCTVELVPVPPHCGIWVLHTGTRHSLAGSAYAERRQSCEAAAELVGPLPSADLAAIEAIVDPVVRRRARHVRTECDRVAAFHDALVEDDLATAGRLMDDSHRSLRDDHEVSTPDLDRAVARLRDTHGVLGARLTGAGFGGCVVALTDESARAAPDLAAVFAARRVRPGPRAAVAVTERN